MIIYKNVNGNIYDIILEMYTNSTNIKYFEYIEINAVNLLNLSNVINIRTITFEEIIENETEKCFIEFKSNTNDIKFIRYNLNLKNYIGNNIYIQKNIFDNQENLFNYNIGVKVNNDLKINIYYNQIFHNLSSTNFTLIPYNCFQFYKITSILLVGDHNIYKVYYKHNNNIVNCTFNLKINKSHITEISIDKILKIIGYINNLVKIESNNLIFFRTNNIIININNNNYENLNLDIMYLNF